MKRILLKLSGEALMGDDDFGINPEVLSYVSDEIGQLINKGLEIGVVIGGGNIFRGSKLISGGIDRVTGDHMGMLATVMNSLAMAAILKRNHLPARVFSSMRIDSICEHYQRDVAVRFLEQGGVGIFSAGTGNPFFTTDSAASLRAIEIGADLLIKATKVNGIYSADPVINPEAIFYPRLSYDQVLADKLGVMDLNAILLCRDHGLKLRVVNIREPGLLGRLAEGESVGTLVE